ncbi:MAG: tripartite tricarboxylate transporter substrate binding protein [Deltaproteobacteria bacterium]|nr:tripartite tricarboxylate transporter substrate binding protein [Deltaproteobacteria bacterium]MBW1960411.1 tripartite tricarboxylate transporter substrate binding protein [Deltaproteobacteria bacterium]MBW1994986.1 tripartite tricarboxylate transporter substrate binding protein [Deltaproteobacteria bacterium]MBW2153423.1 tripartite tricarboxylate transporter substrate binding protein [Deltaproteobacteria bacterium]
MKKLCVVGLMVFLCMGLLVSGTLADNFPSKPIKIIVPFKAGGGTDTSTRLIQKYLEKVLPVKVAIINKGGAAGTIGSRHVLKAKPDGYTLLVNIPNLWTNKFLGTADFDATAFEPIAETWSFAMVEVTRPAAQFKNLKDYIAAAKEKPKNIKQAINIGASTHFCSLAVQDLTGAQFKMVHIGDGASRIAAVLGGHVDSTLMGTNEAIRFHKSGEMRVLGIYGEKPYPGLEEVPTSYALGIPFKFPLSYRFYAPRGTPKDRIEYLADAFKKALDDPELQRKVAAQSCLITYKRGEELKSAIMEEGKLLERIAKKYNLMNLKKKKK